MNGYNHTNGSIPGPSHPQMNGTTTTDVQIPSGPTNQPRVLVRSLNDTDAVFHLSGVETGYANSLRRVMMADVPTICMSFWYFISAFIFAGNEGSDDRDAGMEREHDADYLAIDQVLFTQNTSPIPDEMLAHRLGMVPLVSQKVMDGLRYTRVC